MSNSRVISTLLLAAFVTAAGMGAAYRTGTDLPAVNRMQDAQVTPALSSLSNSGPSMGENIFRAKCAVCHGLDGAGHTPNGKKLKVPDLRSQRIQHHDDEELLDVVTNGKGDMPPFGKKYGSDKLQQVVAYVRSLGQRN